MKTLLTFQIERTLFTALFMFVCLIAWTQQDIDQNQGNNELKLNVGYTLLGFAELSYDHILSDESSIGIAGGFSFDKDIEYDFMVLPNFKFYFGRKRASGFFIEGNMALYSEEYNSNNGNSSIGMGLGIAVGGKFITKNGFVGELILGGGRNLINTDKINEGYPRIGISLGKRF